VIAAYSEREAIVRHIHAHEQRRELDECEAEHGCSPVELLGDTGFLGPRTSVIHGIHVSARDVELLSASGATVVTCPTTEGNLGDGYLPAMTLHAAGIPLAIGSDSQVRLDPFEEVRELETLSRRERERRSGLLAEVGDLWETLVRAGRACLGLEAAEPPTMTIDLEHPDLHGLDPADLHLALATCASAGVVVPAPSRGAAAR
jgi:formimidoylglutamate deiminase